MCSITGVGERLHKVLGQIGPKLWFPFLDVHFNRKPPLTYNWENSVSTFSRLFLIRAFIYLQVTGTCIKSRDEFEFQPDRTTDYGPNQLPLSVKKFSHRLIMGKCCLHASLFIFDKIIIKCAGNQDRHKAR